MRRKNKTSEQKETKCLLPMFPHFSKGETENDILTNFLKTNLQNFSGHLGITYRQVKI